jgi:hypothetical protein
MKLQKLGGYASIATVLVLIASFAFDFFAFRGFGDLSDPIKLMAALPAMRIPGNVSNVLLMVIYILCLVLILALHERMHVNAPYLARLALISASAGTFVKIACAVVRTVGYPMIAQTLDISAYRAFEAMLAGINLTGGHAYAWAFLFMGCAMLNTHTFSRSLGWLFVITGILWLPAFMFVLLMPVVYLTSCVSAVWIGIVLLRQKQPQPAAKEMAAVS